MTKNEILSKAETFIKQKCENETTGHDFFHIERVKKNALKINETEQADEFIIILISLFHDLFDHKFFDGDAKKSLNKVFDDLGISSEISQEDKENIIFSCLNIGFSQNIKEKKKLSKEGEIVQDADRLDALGAIGISRTFAYGGKTGKQIYNPKDEKDDYLDKNRSSFSHFYDKILKLKDLMNTNTGKNMALQRHEFVENYMKQFLLEWEGKK